MDSKVFDEMVRAFVHHLPFRPFVVVRIDGSRFEVDDPQAITIRDGTAGFIAPGGAPVIFDHEGVSQIIGDLASAS